LVDEIICSESTISGFELKSGASLHAAAALASIKPHTMRMLVNFIDVQTHEAKAFHYGQIVPIPKVGGRGQSRAGRPHLHGHASDPPLLSGGLEAHILVQPTVGGRFEIAMKPV
jgi:hypothetical protein